MLDKILRGWGMISDVVVILILLPIILVVSIGFSIYSILYFPIWMLKNRRRHRNRKKLLR
jgi:hypothetical protein